MPFPISCRACGATFNIPDDIYQRRVAGRVVNIRCKQCKADILVDGTKRQLSTGAAASRPPPAVSESSWPAAPQTPPEPEAPERPERADARVNADREPSSPVGETTTPASPPEPSTTAMSRDGEPAAGTPPTDESALPSRAAAEAAAGPTVNEPVRRMPPTDEASQRAGESHATPGAAPSLQGEGEQPASPGAPADLWAVSFGDDDDRELTATQIAEEARQGHLHRDMLVWREGMESWLPLGRVPELARLLPDEAASDSENAAPSSTKAAAPAVPPPLARTTLGVGPVPIPDAAPTAEAIRADDPVAAPEPLSDRAGVSAAAPAPPAPAVILAPPPVSAFGSEPNAPVQEQALLPNPFMDAAAVDPARLQAGAPLQSTPPAHPSQPVSFDLEALPPVKRGRPVLWLTAIVVVVALGIIIGLVTSWSSPEQTVPSAAAPSPDVPAASPPTQGTVVGSPREPTQTTGSVATSGNRVDLFAPPGAAARAPTRATKPEPRKPGPRKRDLAEVFADKLQGKGPKR
jgi:hypothetical protein